MSEQREPERWITVKGKHLPVYADGSIGVGREDRSTDDFTDKDVESLKDIKSIKEFGIQNISPVRDKAFVQALSHIVNANKDTVDTKVISNFSIDYDDLADMLSFYIRVGSKDTVLRLLGDETTYQLFIQPKGGIQRFNLSKKKFESVGATSDYWLKGEDR